MVPSLPEYAAVSAGSATRSPLTHLARRQLGEGVFFDLALVPDRS
jgi:hypothetical protein